jgi:hypothetical protein
LFQSLSTSLILHCGAEILRSSGNANSPFSTVKPIEAAVSTFLGRPWETAKYDESGRSDKSKSDQKVAIHSAIPVPRGRWCLIASNLGLFCGSSPMVPASLRIECETSEFIEINQDVWIELLTQKAWSWGRLGTKPVISFHRSK